MNAIKQVLLTFGRGLVYAIAFLSVALLVMYFVNYPTRRSNQSDDREERRWRQWDEQQRKSEAFLDRSERYYDRLDKLVTKQEELARRFEGVIERWEAQAGTKR